MKLLKSSKLFSRQDKEMLFRNSPRSSHIYSNKVPATLDFVPLLFGYLIFFFLARSCNTTNVVYDKQNTALSRRKSEAAPGCKKASGKGIKNALRISITIWDWWLKKGIPLLSWAIWNVWLLISDFCRIYLTWQAWLTCKTLAFYVFKNFFDTFIFKHVWNGPWE